MHGLKVGLRRIMSSQGNTNYLATYSYLGLKPHAKQTKMHKMHINLASKNQRLLAGRAAGGGAGEKEEGRAYRPAHCTQFQVNGQRQMLISNEILWTIQLVQIFYHPTRRHIYDCRTGRHKAKPQVSGPPSLSLFFPFLHILSLSVCVCVLSPQDIHFAAAAAASSVLGSSSVCVIKRTGQAQRWEITKFRNLLSAISAAAAAAQGLLG